MGTLTKKHFGEIIMSILAVKRTDDGKYMFRLDPEDAFPHGIEFCFSLNEDTDVIVVYAVSLGYELAADKGVDALLLCNKYNMENVIGKASYNEGDHMVQIQFGFTNVSQLSDDYIKLNLVAFPVYGARDFFKEAYKAL